MPGEFALADLLPAPFPAPPIPRFLSEALSAGGNPGLLARELPRVSEFFTAIRPLMRPVDLVFFGSRFAEAFSKLIEGLGEEVPL